MVLGQKNYKEKDGRPYQYHHAKFAFNNLSCFEVISIKLSVTDIQTDRKYYFFHAPVLKVVASLPTVNAPSTELKNGHQIDDSLPFDGTCQS